MAGRDRGGAAPRPPSGSARGAAASSGFSGAPVTRALVICSAILSLGHVLAGKARSKNTVSALAFEPARVIRKGEVWRPFTGGLAFLSAGEAILGLLLIYQFRIFERQFGSRKFSVAALFYILASALAQTLPLLYMNNAWAGGQGGATATAAQSGLYPLIFGLLVPFHFDIPPSVSFRVAGIRLSDKAFTYVLCIQLALCNPPVSLLAAVTGMLAGFLYRWNVCWVKRARPPPWLTSFCIHYLAPLFRFGESLEHRSGRPASAGRDVAGGAGRYAPVNQREEVALGAGRPSGAEVQQQQQQQPVVVDDAALAQLMGMGFDEARARHALQLTDNNVSVATNRLIEGH